MQDTKYYVEHLEVLVARARAEGQTFLAYLLEMALAEASAPRRRRAKLCAAKSSPASTHVL
jgi:hypothetical protein